MGQFTHGDASVEHSVSPVSAARQRLVVRIPGHWHRRPVLRDSVLALYPAVRQGNAAYHRLQNQEVAHLGLRNAWLFLQGQYLAVSRGGDAPLHAPFVAFSNERVALSLSQGHVARRQQLHRAWPEQPDAPGVLAVVAQAHRAFAGDDYVQARAVPDATPHIVQGHGVQGLPLTALVLIVTRRAREQAQNLAVGTAQVQAATRPLHDGQRRQIRIRFQDFSNPVSHQLHPYHQAST